MLWQFRRELISALSNFSNITISTPFNGHEKDFEDMGCKCINTTIDRRGINPLVDLKLLLSYRKILKAEQPDAVITYSIKPNIYAGLLCRLKNIPYYTNVQGLGTAFQNKILSYIATSLYRFALKKSTAVFFENNANANEFVSRKIILQRKCIVLKGAGVNLETYPYEEYPKENKGINFLFVGRIMKEKGIDEFFEAAQKIKKLYQEKVNFHVVGFFEDEYKEIITKLTTNKIIMFHGFQPDPKPFYKNAHCVILPSYHEGMSNVLLEAAATGRALITTDIPGCREAVDNSINGLLCEKMNAKSLENCITNFLSLTPCERKSMGAAGRTKMEKEFDKNVIVKNTLNIILSKN